jgi:hypothetical protein
MTRTWKNALAAIAMVCATMALSLASHVVAAGEDGSDTAGWKTVAGGPGTGCGTDATPYEFYVHPGDPRRVALYFQGGGGCWNSRNCGLDGQRTFKDSVGGG